VSVKNVCRECIGWLKFFRSIPYIVFVFTPTLLYLEWREKRTRAAQWKHYDSEQAAKQVAQQENHD